MENANKLVEFMKYENCFLSYNGKSLVASDIDNTWGIYEQAYKQRPRMIWEGLDLEKALEILKGDD